jgi:cell division protein FtsL
MNKVLIVFMALMLMGCAPDSWRDAEAYKTRVLADSQVAVQAQQSQQSADLHKIEMEKQAVDQQNRVAAQAKWQMVSNWMMLAFGVAACVAILAAGGSVSYAVVGTSKALVKYADIRAELQGNLISMDKTTRTFPLLRQVGKGNIWAWGNPNTDSVRLLDANNPGDRQMITALAGVAMAGVQYSETGKANSPQDMSMIETPMVDASVPGLQVGYAASVEQLKQLLRGENV